MSEKTDDYYKHLKFELDHAHQVMAGLLRCNQNKDITIMSLKWGCLISLAVCSLLVMKVLFFP